MKLKSKILIFVLLLVFIILCTIIYFCFKNPNIAVLCYHNIATSEEKDNFPSESDWTITVDNFKEQLEYLKNNNYKTLTMEEFYNWKTGKIDLPYKSVLITFDDGFLSNYEYAFPLLKQYDMNATVFVVGSFIENSTESKWNGNLQTYMSKEILEKVKEEYPNIDIYSHSYNLHYDGAINQNLEKLEEDINDFNSFLPNTNVYCYPFGKFTDDMENALSSCGYKMAFRYGPNKEDYKKAKRNENIYEISRLNVSHGMNVKKFALRLLMYN